MVDDAMYSSDSKEWETPPEFFGYLNSVLGPFDLDPAATNENALCDMFYGLDVGEDGLKLPWFGKVFINPPYGRGKLTEKWVRKIFREVARNKEVDFVVALLPSRTETIWFHWVMNCCTGIGVMYREESGFRKGFWTDTTLFNSDRNAGGKRVLTEVVFVKSRLKFFENGVESENQAPFPSVIVIFRRNEQWVAKGRRRGKRKSSTS